MFPNKADLSDLKAELKADIHGEAAHLAKWMAATAITMVIGFGGMILTVLSRLSRARAASATVVASGTLLAYNRRFSTQPWQVIGNRVKKQRDRRSAVWLPT